MITLNWINSEPCRWQVFVSNRVAQIQELTEQNQWRHIPSMDNPADLASRGMDASTLVNADIWWTGPQWLSQTEENWPSKEIKGISEVPEARKNKMVFINVQKLDLFSKYSSLHRLQRVTAYCLKFIDRTKNKTKNPCSEISGDELKNALWKLIRIAQLESFSSEIKRLKAGQSLPSDSGLLGLDPFLIDDLLRVGGRLTNSDYPFDTRHPIILPKGHKLTYLIIRDEHLRNLHVGPQGLLATIRQRFWPVNGLNTIKGVLRTCITCFRAKPKDVMYKMANLPRVRALESKPFDNVGIDFAGPFNIKDGKLRNRAIIKAYLCIFVCFTTKAVHLEVVGELSTDAFLNALKRFISRRGLCQNIYTDNGTNFVGANNHLKKLTSETQKIEVFCAKNHIRWHFIPVRSPHYGGLWEAAVRSAKKHFKRVIGDIVLTFEELYTVFVQIESVLNSRPLMPISNHPNDLLALTPGHFLIGKPLNALPQENVTEVPSNKLKQYRRLQQMYQHFWQRWSTKYIQTLQQRTKWQQQYTNVKIDDMVVIKDERAAPQQWKLGRVIEILPGQDGVIRTVKLKTAAGETTTTVKRVCVLPFCTEERDSI
ncbi:uncharacterized protein [Onthophagus taurus]|uniref:uncharacterized protein n=1 Tax=Onthophagus taurus TaxID=166361 RepID=UPI0039BE04BD